ncbi:hypothetical protein ASF51_12130 [Agreia sp. Leaf283]|nr:hypothetical protein ASF51_12130 [Agreia sp. Leaf283]
MPLDVYPIRQAQPLLLERLNDPQALAAIFERDEISAVLEGYDSVLWLPDQARSHLPDWLLWVFARWRVVTPDAFPVSAEWETVDEWASAEELEARTALAAFDASEAQRLAKIKSQRLIFTHALENAALAGNDHRQLLKATGESLEMAVATALRALEFEVVDADALPENQGYKKEDLRVSDGKWVAIVEVKGYTKAGKSNDLQQVNKAAKTFARTTGRDADAIWLVVNSFREMDPAQRPLLIPDRPDEIATFAEDDHGLIIDTRDLFKLWQAVTTGALDASAARAHLRASIGRFGFVGADTATDLRPELSTEQAPG